jgi:hypothetical protein
MTSAALLRTSSASLSFLGLQSRRRLHATGRLNLALGGSRGRAPTSENTTQTDRYSIVRGEREQLGRLFV